MAKVSIKTEKITPFGGIFHVRELFSRYIGSIIDKVLGLRCTTGGAGEGRGETNKITKLYFIFSFFIFPSVGG
ncbi:MAG: hypothetical protein K6G92_14210 [Bacteroidaceae bacterium]|nr:hypothetical protein [Bacteroidaceae bacterium]